MEKAIGDVQDCAMTLELKSGAKKALDQKTIQAVAAECEHVQSEMSECLTSVRKTLLSVKFFLKEVGQSETASVVLPETLKRRAFC